MANTVLLDNVAHHDLRVSPAFGADYGDGVNQMLVFPNEFEEVQREYPIVFRKDENGRFFAITILGLDRDENVFLTDGRWNARYVPALSRRNAFHIGYAPNGAGQDEPKVFCNMDDPRVGATNGLPLFLPQGGHAPFLNHIMDALQTIHLGAPMVDAMFAAFAEYELVQPLSLEVSLREGHTLSFPDVYAVDAERFRDLRGDALSRLHEAGFLGCALWALSSLANMNDLIARKNAMAAGASE